MKPDSFLLNELCIPTLITMSDLINMKRSYYKSICIHITDNGHTVLCLEGDGTSIPQTWNFLLGNIISHEKNSERIIDDSGHLNRTALGFCILSETFK